MIHSVGIALRLWGCCAYNGRVGRTFLAASRLLRVRADFKFREGRIQRSKDDFHSEHLEYFERKHLHSINLRDDCGHCGFRNRTGRRSLAGFVVRSRARRSDHSPRRFRHAADEACCTPELPSDRAFSISARDDQAGDSTIFRRVRHRWTTLQSRRSFGGLSASDKVHCLRFHLAPSVRSTRPVTSGSIIPGSRCPLMRRVLA